MANQITLYRGLAVKDLKVLLKNWFGITNPTWHPLRESNWPGGLSLSKNDAFELAVQIANDHGGIPVGGKFIISEDILPKIQLTGIKRILDPSEGMSVGSIDYWRCFS